MSGRFNRFLGDTLGRVIVKLVLASLVVGVVMRTFRWSPYDLVWCIRDFILHIWSMGFSAIEYLVNYMVLGAIIVVPIFILLRILNYRR